MLSDKNHSAVKVHSVWKYLVGIICIKTFCSSTCESVWSVMLAQPSSNSHKTSQRCSRFCSSFANRHVQSSLNNANLISLFPTYRQQPNRHQLLFESERCCVPNRKLYTIHACCYLFDSSNGGDYHLTRASAIALLLCVAYTRGRRSYHASSEQPRLQGRLEATMTRRRENSEASGRNSSQQKKKKKSESVTDREKI